MKTWIISKSVERRAIAFEMWMYRRINRIRLTKKVQNEEILRKVEVHRPILLKVIKERLTTIRERQTVYVSTK